MHAELQPLMKREVFRLVIKTPKGVKHVEYILVFVRKRYEIIEIIRCKT